MAAAYDPFGLQKRKEETTPRTGPAVPNMGGFPTTPLSPSANLNPFAIPPVASPDQGGRPTTGGVGPSAPPTSPMPTAAASPASPPTSGQPQPPTTEQPAAPSGVTINVGEKAQEKPKEQEGQPSPSASGGPSVPPQGPVPGLPPSIPLARMPTAPEMNFAPQGTVFETPNGSMTRGADGNWQFQPNEMGVLKYKQKKVQDIQKFNAAGAHPLVSDPNAPLPPIEPGQPWFNPFGGQHGTFGGVD